MTAIKEAIDILEQNMSFIQEGIEHLSYREVLKVVEANTKTALAKLKEQPKCKTCGDYKEILMTCAECRKKRGRYCRIPNCPIIPCSDCTAPEQPPAKDYDTRTIENTLVCPCGNVFVEADDYDTLGSESGVCCPNCGNEEFRTIKELIQQPPSSEFTRKLRSFVKMYENEIPRRAEITFLKEACIHLDNETQRADKAEEDARIKDAAWKVISGSICLLYNHVRRIDPEYAKKHEKGIDESVNYVKQLEAKLKDLLEALEEAHADFYYIHQHSEDAHTDSYNFMEKVKVAIAKEKKG